MEGDSSMGDESEADEFFDSEAPYGRFANGKPRRTPKGSNVRAPAKRSRPKASAGLKEVAPDYKAAASGVVTLVSALFGLVGRRSPAFLADSTVIVQNRDAFAEVGADLALQDVRVARFLEQLATATPLTRALEKLAAPLAQIATNHGLVPVGTMGSVSVGEILKAGRKAEVKENAAAGRLCHHCGSPEIQAVDQEGKFYCQVALDEMNAQAAMAEAAAVVAGDGVS